MTRSKVQLFITCLSEQFFPFVLENMVSLLERLGVETIFPPEQTCCGQPLYNSGFKNGARHMPIVSPSGSCVDMVRRLGVIDVHAHFPRKTTCHASCHYLRGLGLRTEAKQLLAHVRGKANHIITTGGGLREAGSSVKALHLIDILAAKE